MRPSSLQLRPVAGRVPALAGAAAGQRLRAGLLVRVRDDHGRAGQGEASPLPGYSPDTLAECARQLAAVDLAAIAPPGAQAATAWTRQALRTAGVRAPAARFALETALLDWLGQQQSRSVAELLGDGADTARRIPLAALVADAAGARLAHARGIRCFKLKIAPDTFDQDLRLAHALREEFGSAVALRFDANGRFAPEAVRSMLARLAPLAPEFVEEPAPLAAFARIVDAPVALAADESLARPGAWPALASVCRVVVLKPTLLGGLDACLRLAHEAGARGLAATVGHTFDGPVALAAAAELACALPGVPLACGLDRHPALAAWPQTAVAQWRGAFVSSAGGPGLALPQIAPR